MSDRINIQASDIEASVAEYDAKRRQQCMVVRTIVACLAAVLSVISVYFALFNTHFELVEGYNEEVKEYGIRVAHSSAFVVTIPSEYEGKQITFIDDYNATNENMRFLFIEEGIKRIGETPRTEVGESESDLYNSGSFSRTNLWYVQLPSTLEYIGPDSFYLDVQLFKVDWPETMEQCIIGPMAFSGCRLGSLELPEGVTGIDKFAFAACEMKKLSIPDTVTAVGYYAFSDCDKLKSVRVSEGMNHLGVAMFKGCNYLKTVENTDHLEYYCVSALEETAVDMESNPQQIFYDGAFYVNGGVEAENQKVSELSGIPIEVLEKDYDSQTVWVEGKEYAFPMTWEELCNMDEWETEKPYDTSGKYRSVVITHKASGRKLRVIHYAEKIVGIESIYKDEGNQCLVVLPGGIVPGYTLLYRESTRVDVNPGDYPMMYFKMDIMEDGYVEFYDNGYETSVEETLPNGKVNRVEYCVE